MEADRDNPGRWVFPAHAGMSRDAWLTMPELRGFPRTRGDEPTLKGITVPD